MPKDDIYLPLHVGREGKDDIVFTGDNTGDNISNKNASFCELTGLYWACLNLDADYIGLVHYRKHFTAKGKKGSKFQRIINRDELNEILKKYDVVLPMPRHYYIETNYSQYVHAHHEEDLIETRKIIKKKISGLYSCLR